MTFNWDDKSKSKLRNLWLSGLSATKIGAQMGLSKNAVIGKAHRMNLPLRAKPIAFATRSGVSKKRDKPVEVAAPKEQEKPVEAVESPAPVVSQQRRVLYTPPGVIMRTCRFPSGDPRKSDFRFCGKPTVTGKPYCAACCNIAYARPMRAA
jgi:GcrA cell cycle regulator